ncbi:MAG: hypothetical protein LDL30_01085, partial [Desulfovibrio sp.]|nr:hypothetical protein [Desulfovibrio sp.]
MTAHPSQLSQSSRSASPLAGPRIEALVAFLALALAPHVTRLPLWVTGLALLSWTYVLLAPRLRWRLPPRRLLQGITLLAVAAAMAAPAVTTGQSRSLAGGVAVLAVVMGLKPLE